MADYKLTNRGKFVLGLVILSFVIVIVYSGSYIINYIMDERPKNQDRPVESSEETIASAETTGASDETTEDETDTTEATDITDITEATDTTDTTDTTVSTDSAESTDASITTEMPSEAIYSKQDLEDLKLFKIIITFEENQSETKLSEADLESIRAMMVKYPTEKLSIDGHVNGYPKYKTDDASNALSLERALNVEEALIDLGIDKKLISVYNFGSEAPLYIDFGNQSKNDRVEIYFLDHYIKGSRGK